MKRGKRMRALAERFADGEAYPAARAFELLKDAAAVKFDESVDVSVNLGIDPRKGDQTVRGAVALPGGLGKTARVAVFALAEKAQEALDAGADAAGLEDLAARVGADDFPFDVVIATPEAMPTVGKLGPVLGPRGLMPNPKLGTVTPDVAAAVKRAKAGQATYRADRGGIVHCSIGRASFDAPTLERNLNALVADLVRAKPEAVKGVYLKKLTVSTTMGPGLEVDIASLEAS